MANSLTFTPTGLTALSATYLNSMTLPPADNQVIYEPLTGHGMVAKTLGAGQGLNYAAQFTVVASTHALLVAAISAWLTASGKPGSLVYGFGGAATTYTVASYLRSIEYEQISPVAARFTAAFQTVVT